MWEILHVNPGRSSKYCNILGTTGPQILDELFNFIHSCLLGSTLLLLAYRMWFMIPDETISWLKVSLSASLSFKDSREKCQNDIFYTLLMESSSLVIETKHKMSVWLSATKTGTILSKSLSTILTLILMQFLDMDTGMTLTPVHI